MAAAEEAAMQSLTWEQMSADLPNERLVEGESGDAGAEDGWRVVALGEGVEEEPDRR